MSDKVFAVIGPNETILVRAKGPKTALDHVIRDRYKATQISAGELLDYIGNGYKVEDSKDDEPEDVQQTLPINATAESHNAE